MPHNTIQDIHKCDYKVNNIGSSRFTEKFPIQIRLPDTLRPSTIVEGRPKVDMVQINIAFGSYAMVHIGTIDTMKIRCVPESALKASNDSGWYYFMNLFTGKRMHRYNCK